MPFSETLQKPSVKFTLFLMLIAYLFSFAIRLIWVWHFKDTPEFYWNGQIMINTNDGYFFASGVQKALWGMHADNPLVPGFWDRGLVFVTAILVKILPFSFETIILYMPAIFSGLIVVPLILLGRLYGNIWWGFLAALLASITWSYYNRTMIGYYDSDQLALIFPFFILYFLIHFLKTRDLKSVLFAALFFALYPFAYAPAGPVAGAIILFYLIYIFFLYYRNRDISLLQSAGILLLSAIPIPLISPYNFVSNILMSIMAFLIYKRTKISEKRYILITIILLFIYLYFGHIAQHIMAKVITYTNTGTDKIGLHFYDVFQTIREAGKIPFDTFAKRISGSQFGFFLSMIGYVVLIYRHRSFLLSVPLLGIGFFAYWGGLRFTVYAVPVAALGSVYLFWVIGEFFRNRQVQYLFTALATVGMLYPNIQHVIDYRVPTVFNHSEVTDLDTLKKLSSPKDYTLTWWDYGYPLWFYSGTNTLIDGGKHRHDNFLISKILQTDSPILAAKLARLSVEKYVQSQLSYKKYLTAGKRWDSISPEFKLLDKHGQYYHSNKGMISNVLFRDNQPDQKDPNLFLDQLKEGLIPLPKKTRDVYLYLPYRMMGIFPTVMVFGNIDLTTGNALRKPIFYPTSARGERNGQILFANGMLFDLRKGVLHIGNHEEKVAKFVVTQNAKGNHIKVEDQRYHLDGNLIVVYLKSYGRFVIMDRQTFQSMYVQMFMLGRYDKRYFEPVVVSPYSRIYRLKI